MTIGVTGATGRLGTALLRELPLHLPRESIVAIAREPGRIAATGITLREGDYQSMAGMKRALQGVEQLILISAPVAGGNDRVVLHRNVLQAARNAGVRRVLFTSVIGNGLEQDTDFWQTQQVNRQTETDLKASGLEWVIGRNGLYLELDLIQMRRADETGVYTNAAGNGRCAYITIDELAYAYARLVAPGVPAAAHSGKTYNLIGACHTQAELVALANAVFALRLRYQAISDEECLDKYGKLFPERGEAVARMLTGCFQCIRAGAFDVPSDFVAATGRQAKSMRQMLEECRQKPT